jgi:hypothetical protein
VCEPTPERALGAALDIRRALGIGAAGESV